MKFSEWLAQRLLQPLPGQAAQSEMMPFGGSKRFPIPENSRKSSVLMLLFPCASSFRLIAIERSIDGGVHSGQIAFPGGKIEPWDDSPEVAALREANEEINLSAQNVQILGRLSALYIPASRFEVFPIVAMSPACPGGLQPSDAEVAEILSIPFPEVFEHKSIIDVSPSSRPSVRLKAPGYVISERHFLWGASAMMLSELEVIWKEYLTTIDV